MADVAEAGTERAVCPQCTFRYEVVTGHAVDAPHGELLLATDLDARTATFRVPLTREDVAVPPGTLAAVIHVAGDEGRGEAVAIQNLSTGQHFALADPGGRAVGHAALGGVSVTLAVIFLLALFGLPWPVIIALAAAAGVGTFRWIERRDAPRARLSASDRGALHHKRGLLERKEELQRKIRMLHHEREQKTALGGRLRRLAGKMEEVGTDLYGARLANVEAGLRTVERQVAVDDRLLAGYTRTIKIIEIELESSASADLLAGGLTGALGAGEAELEALAAEHAELVRQLAANDEVERLLRTG